MIVVFFNDFKFKLILVWIVIFFFIFIYLVVLLVFLFQFFSWKVVGMVFLFYVIIGGIGIILGFYCCIFYCSFNVFKWLEYIFVICGILVCQGGVFEWVGLYCMYYKFFDIILDFYDFNKGFWWSYIGWMMFEIFVKVDIFCYIKDI